MSTTDLSLDAQTTGQSFGPPGPPGGAVVAVTSARAQPRPPGARTMTEGRIDRLVIPLTVGGGGGGCGAATTKLTLDVFPYAVAVITALPSVTPFTTPDADTVAAAGLLELQVTMNPPGGSGPTSVYVTSSATESDWAT